MKVRGLGTLALATHFLFCSLSFSKEAKNSLSRVEAHYKKASGFSAAFKQLTVNPTTQVRKTTSGKIWFKRPSKIRWQTDEGEKSVLVSDGTTYWYYTPPFDANENGQAIKTKRSKLESRLIEKLLSGSFSLAKELRTQVTSDTYYVLTPRKKGAAGTVQKIVLELDPKEPVIKKVTLEHSGGSVAEIELSSVTLEKELDDEMFKFTPPPKTDVVEE